MLPLSCTHEQKPEVRQDEIVNQDVIAEQQGNPNPAQLRIQQHIAGGMQQAQRHLQAKEFQKALNVYRSLLVKYPQEKSLVDAYVRTIEDIKGSADKSFDDEDHVRAGKIYAVLSKNYSTFKAFSRTLSFSKASLRTRIDECAACLYRKGIEHYRQNEFSSAISVWESVLSFDPHNAKTKKAVATAQVQVRNLQNVK